MVLNMPLSTIRRRLPVRPHHEQPPLPAEQRDGRAGSEDGEEYATPVTRPLHDTCTTQLPSHTSAMVQVKPNGVTDGPSYSHVHPIDSSAASPRMAIPRGFPCDYTASRRSKLETTTGDTGCALCQTYPETHQTGSRPVIRWCEAVSPHQRTHHGPNFLPAPSVETADT